MSINIGQYGQWICSAIINGQLMTMQYYGYTKKESVKLFKLEELS